jgi:hypothetical protein
MKYVYYIAFISIVVVIGWIFRPVEHMSSGTCKRRIYGPVGMDGKTYPEVYGPDRFVYGDRRGGGSSNSTGGGGTSNNIGGVGGSSNSSEQNQAAMYEDDGEFSSNTATRNAAYMNVFTFKPYAKTNFPVSGPPEPYLSDFANFHR